MTVFEICGVASGVISVVDAAPYIRDTIRGDTKPHRGTWLIWSVLAIVALASQVAQHGGWSVLMIATQVLFTTTIWLLSLRRGYGSLSTRERVMLVIAAIGVIAWAVADDPVAATARSGKPHGVLEPWLGRVDSALVRSQAAMREFHDSLRILPDSGRGGVRQQT